jgi:hypothetical protein
MMQVTLMNFGANTRVVNDSNNTAVSIGIGQIVETDVHDVHFHMIRRCVATETLLVVPKDVKQSDRLRSIMELLRGIETEPYDELLTQYFKVIPQGEDINIRPHRTEMRLQLLDHARREVAVALQLQSKVNIREEGDKVTRDRDPKTVVVPPEESQNPKKVESPDAKDKAPRKSQKARSGSSKIRREPPPQSSKLKIKRERL